MLIIIFDYLHAGWHKSTIVDAVFATLWSQNQITRIETSHLRRHAAGTATFLRHSRVKKMPFQTNMYTLLALQCVCFQKSLASNEFKRNLFFQVLCSPIKISGRACTLHAPVGQFSHVAGRACTLHALWQHGVLARASAAGLDGA